MLRVAHRVNVETQMLPVLACHRIADRALSRQLSDLSLLKLPGGAWGNILRRLEQPDERLGAFQESRSLVVVEYSL